MVLKLLDDYRIALRKLFKERDAVVALIFARDLIPTGLTLDLRHRAYLVQMLLPCVEPDALEAELAWAIQFLARTLMLFEIGRMNDLSAVWTFDQSLRALQEVLLCFIKRDELESAPQRTVDRFAQALLDVLLVLDELDDFAAHRAVGLAADDVQVVSVLIQDLDHLLGLGLSLAGRADRLAAHLRLPAIEAGLASHRCLAVTAHKRVSRKAEAYLT